MKVSEAFPSKYLKAEDLGGREIKATMSNVVMETLRGEHGDESKMIVYFQGAQKGLVLNKTNANSISDLYGDETNDWLGKEILLFAMPVESFGKMTTGLRVRAPQMAQPFYPAGQAPQQAAQALPPVTTAPPVPSQPETQQEEKPVGDFDDSIPF